jgi:hypothetical protein
VLIQYSELQRNTVHGGFLTSISGISCAGDDVQVCLLLQSDELGNELGVVGEVCVHDDDKVPAGVLYTVNVRRPCVLTDGKIGKKQVTCVL